MYVSAIADVQLSEGEGQKRRGEWQRGHWSGNLDVAVFLRPLFAPYRWLFTISTDDCIVYEWRRSRLSAIGAREEPKECLVLPRQPFFLLLLDVERHSRLFFPLIAIKTLHHTPFYRHLLKSSD